MTRGTWGGVLQRLRRGARDADAALREAVLSALDRDWDGVELALRDLVRRDSEDVALFLALARVYRERGEIGRAIRVHQNVLLRKSLTAAERRRALRGLAEDLSKGGFAARAIPAYEAWLEDEPRSCAGWSGLATLRAEQGDLEGALQAERRARRAARGDPAQLARVGRAEAALLVRRAQQARQEGQARAADRFLRDACKVDPQGAEPQLALALQQAEAGRGAKAIQSWREVLAREPERAGEALPELRRRMREKDVVRLDGVIDEVVERRPEIAAVRLARARFRLAGGAPEQALQDAREVQQRSPESPGSLLLEARALLALKREAEAEEVLRRLDGPSGSATSEEVA